MVLGSLQAAPLVGITPIFAIYFWGFEQGKEIAKVGRLRYYAMPLPPIPRAALEWALLDK